MITRALSTAKPMKLADKFTFGPYKNATLQEVIHHKPAYVIELKAQVKTFFITHEAEELIKSVMENTK
jgi:hypothetical protein